MYLVFWFWPKLEWKPNFGFGSVSAMKTCFGSVTTYNIVLALDLNNRF